MGEAARTYKILDEIVSRIWEFNSILVRKKQAGYLIFRGKDLELHAIINCWKTLSYS
jgi:hypothetical protein